MRVGGGARWGAVVVGLVVGCSACSSQGTVRAAGAAAGAPASSAVSSAAASSAPGSPSSAASAPVSGSAPASAPDALTAGLTQPGAHVAFGQAATLGWVPSSQFSVTDAEKGYKLQVTVESIQKGTAADLKDLQLTADEQGSTPYYVKVRIKFLEAIPASQTDNPEVTLDAIDDRGQKQSAVIFLGTFDRCPDNDPPKPFASGKSFESCMTYLMPGGGSIQKVQWGDGPNAADENTPYFDSPVTWP